jgi:hypothetical protein
VHNPNNILNKSGDKTLRRDLGGGFTVKLMKLASGPVTGTNPFQGSERGPSNAFTLSYVFEKFSKVRYFNYNRLSIIDVCQAGN